MTRESVLDQLGIAPLASIEEMNQVVELQKEIWGYGLPGSDPPYPARALLSLVKSGGLVAGCRVGSRLAGFALAWIGKAQTKPRYYLHSQLVGVLPAFRRTGIGHRLKLFQRRYALDNDMELIRWTFDPLRAANCNLNLRKLGVVCSEFQRDLYGPLQSTLDSGIESDRVWADWWVSSRRVRTRLEGIVSPKAVPDLPLVNTDPKVSHSATVVPLCDPLLDLTDPLLLVHIPADISRLQREQPNRAARWRLEIRTVLECYLSKGYLIDEFYGETKDDSPQSYLRLNRSDPGTVLN